MASFENYKLDVLKSFQKGDDTNKSNYAPDDQTLHVMYEAAKADKIQSVRHRANGNIIIGGLLVTICAILFVTHWRWLRKLNKV